MSDDPELLAVVVDALEHPSIYTDVPQAWMSKAADMQWRAAAILNAIDAHVLRSERAL